ncbi:hypothetical protein D3C80_127840 [compost metagenome]
MTTTNDLDLFEALGAEVERASKTNESRNIALEVDHYKEVDGEMCVFGYDMLTGKMTQVSLLEDKGAAARSYPRTSLEQRAGNSNRGIKPGGIIILERAYEQPETNDELVVAKANWTHVGTSDAEDGAYFSKFMTVQLIPARHGKQCAAFVEWVGNTEDDTRVCSTMEEVTKGVADLIKDGQIDAVRPHVHVRLIDIKANKTIVLADLVRNNGNAANQYQRESVEAYMERAFTKAGDKSIAIVRGLFDRFAGKLPDEYKLELLRGGSMPMTKNRRAKLFDNNGQIPPLKPDGGKPVGQVLKDIFSVGQEGKRDTPLFTVGHVALKNSVNQEGVLFLSYANPVSSYAEFVELKDIPSSNYQPAFSNIMVKDANIEPEELDEELGASADDVQAIAASVNAVVAAATSTSQSQEGDNAEGQPQAGRAKMRT